MPKVVFNYNKCKGTGDCVDACPLNLLELSKNEEWCKPVDEKVDNKEAVEKFHDEVEGEEAPADVVIKNEMSECIECRACVVACPESAISLEPKE